MDSGSQSKGNSVIVKSIGHGYRRNGKSGNVKQMDLGSKSKLRDLSDTINGNSVHVKPVDLGGKNNDDSIHVKPVDLSDKNNVESVHVKLGLQEQ